MPTGAKNERRAALSDISILKPLPVGIQTFGDIMGGGFLYVDKTRWIYELVRYPKGGYFLSRPRRFGKSLLLSTLEAIFRGRRGRKGIQCGMTKSNSNSTNSGGENWREP